LEIKSTLFLFKTDNQAGVFAISDGRKEGRTALLIYRRVHMMNASNNNATAEHGHKTSTYH
jgi:hypothetical protein